MKITPEIQIVEQVVNEKEQKALGTIYNPKDVRKNNRKTTSGRKNQYIFCLDCSVFPPIKTTKIIKH